MTDVRSDLVLEIVELEEGELAIRNPDSETKEPMISVAFSDELKEKLGDQCLDVARVMLTAGIQMVAEAGIELEAESADFEEEETPVLH